MTATERLRIFVVEDEALLALDLEDILVDLGHEVIAIAGSTELALEVLRDFDTPPDAAIVDANLGGQSARPVVDALCALSVAVVLASGYGRADLARLGFESPSIHKPYSSRDVAAALTSSL